MGWMRVRTLFRHCEPSRSEGEAIQAQKKPGLLRVARAMTKWQENSLNIHDLKIKSLTMDSRRVQPGDLFIAVPGLTTDGREYIFDAIQKGAAAVLYEYSETAKVSSSLMQSYPIIPVSNLSQFAGVFIQSLQKIFPSLALQAPMVKPLFLILLLRYLRI